MKALICICLILVPIHANASISFELGKQLYVMDARGGCPNCHGKTGEVPLTSAYPKIHGQNKEYLVNQMLAFSHKTRKSGLYPLMELVIEQYTIEEIESIALYLSQVDSKK